MGQSGRALQMLLEWHRRTLSLAPKFGADYNDFEGAFVGGVDLSTSRVVFLAEDVAI